MVTIYLYTQLIFGTISNLVQRWACNSFATRWEQLKSTSYIWEMRYREYQ